MKSSPPNKLTGKIEPNGMLGAVLVAALGLGLFYSSLGLPLQRFSYDFPFELRSVAAPQDAVIVAIDEASYKALNQLYRKTWNRGLHARLLNRLKEAGAKAVVFDIIFSDPDPDAPEGDKQLEEAIRANGKVVLAGEVIFDRDIRGVETERLFPPAETFATAAAAWGDVTLPVDPDGVIRRHLSTATEPHSLAWTGAKVAGAIVTESPERAKKVRWINYYGPPRTIPSVSYHQALDPKGVSEGFFRDKVVFVGQHLQTGLAGALKDTFGTAYTRLGRDFSSGTEIQATIFLNLLREDWLVRIPAVVEITLLLLAGVGFGLGLTLPRPLFAVIVATVGAALTFLLGWGLFRYQLLWFAWAVVLVQIGAALLWSVVAHSVQVYLLKLQLKAHFSKKGVEEMLNNPKMLEPGGQVQEVSFLFSDIANFSKVAQLLEPDDLFKLLNNYYDAALKSIHDSNGTVVQLIGDAIYAVWNAPVAQADHAARACRSALDLHRQLVGFDAEHASVPLRTRIGVHTGVATVGNLGSKRRFDFACIGENVNLASRLEGLNKHLGTDVLATRAIQKSIEEEVVSRPVGHFQFKGFGQAVEVHELICKLQHPDPTQRWREAFVEGLRQFQRKKFGAASENFKVAIRLRREIEQATAPDKEELRDDGPSTFYLKKIEAFKTNPPPENWHGEISMDEK